MSAHMNAAKKILVVSNNVLSRTRNNGKTILSFIEGIDPENVRQLYFNGEVPSVDGYSYFQLSDKDIIRGFLNSGKRGRVWNSFQSKGNAKAAPYMAPNVKRSSFFRLMRDILWFGHWKSNALEQWLDEFRPNTVLFVAGDSGFAYSIANYIVKRYQTRLVTYITDDYIMPHSAETFFDYVKRMRIRKKMLSCISKSDSYFTISSLMRTTYASLFEKDSEMLMNITPSLYDREMAEKSNENDDIVMIYTGSLYYGRDRVLGRIADAAGKYNAHRENGEKAIRIQVYSNVAPVEQSKMLFERVDCCSYCGSLAPNELKSALNRANVLLFVESFDPAMQEKTKYSLSTKVPEYMSVRKPIFAVGPKSIGSMDYLSDVAFCANSEDEINIVMMKMLESPTLCMETVNKAVTKYNRFHDMEKQRDVFQSACFWKN